MAWAPDYITDVQLKSYVRIPDTADDAEVASAITAASRAIDDHCNRQFGKVDAPEQRLYTARPDCKRGVWVIPVDDFQTATGLVVTVAGVTASAFTKEPVNAVAKGKVWTRLSILPDAAVKPTGAEFEVAVTALWGWLAVPGAVVQAAKFQSSRFLSRRKAPFGVAGSPDQGSEIRLLALDDPDAKVAVRGLRRPRRFG